jgi:hypothetical protein
VNDAAGGLDLSQFVGATLAQVRIGAREVQFVFSPGGTIDCMGNWQLRFPDGAVIDHQPAGAPRDLHRVCELIGNCVNKKSFAPSPSFSFDFTSGHRLTIFDEHREYASVGVPAEMMYVVHSRIHIEDP